MKIDLPVGTRGRLVEFNDSYTREFLKKYGVKFYTTSALLGTHVLAETVPTKYGELVVHDYNTLTYLGHKKWSVAQNSKEKVK